MKRMSRILALLLLAALLGSVLVACGKDQVAPTPEKAKKALEKEGFKVTIDENAELSGGFTCTRVIAVRNTLTMFIFYFDTAETAQECYFYLRELMGDSFYYDEETDTKWYVGIHDNYFWRSTSQFAIKSSYA